MKTSPLVQNNLPFTQQDIGESKFIREFSQDVESEELVWHRDKKDRKVKIIESDGWQFQMEDQLPYVLNEGDTLFIPNHVYHRVIKGKGKLIVEIEE